MLQNQEFTIGNPIEIQMRERTRPNPRLLELFLSRKLRECTFSSLEHPYFMGKLQADHENCEKTSKSNFHFFRDAKFPFGVVTYL